MQTSLSTDPGGPWCEGRGLLAEQAAGSGCQGLPRSNPASQRWCKKSTVCDISASVCVSA